MRQTYTAQCYQPNIEYGKDNIQTSKKIEIPIKFTNIERKNIKERRLTDSEFVEAEKMLKLY